MTDDALICQVPTCFGLATWKYFMEIEEKVIEPQTLYGEVNPRYESTQAGIQRFDSAGGE